MSSFRNIPVRSGCSTCRRISSRCAQTASKSADDSTLPRRRLRGSVAQYFLATLVVMAANLDKIHDFVAQKAEDGLDFEAGIEAPRAKQRKPRRSSALQRVTHQRGRAKRNPVRT